MLAAGLSGTISCGKVPDQGDGQHEVKNLIDHYFNAQNSGNLELLRSYSCGDLYQYYTRVIEGNDTEFRRSVIGSMRGNPVRIVAIDVVSRSGSSIRASIFGRVGGSSASVKPHITSGHQVAEITKFRDRMRICSFSE